MSTEKLSELSKPVAQAYYDEHDSSTMLIDWLGDSVPEEPTALYSQEYVSSLLAEREASKKSNAFLKEWLAKLANFNPDWDMLEACRESWREVAAALNDAKAKLEAKDKRIAELERANKSQDDHINQQQDRIDWLEKTNSGLARGLAAAEKLLEDRLEKWQELASNQCIKINELQYKLAVPVRLPLPAQQDITCVLLDKREVSAAIHAAGFKIEGEEKC